MHNNNDDSTLLQINYEYCTIRTSAMSFKTICVYF